MHTVCAWCKNPLPADVPEGDRTTHGICAPCARRLLAEAPIPLERYLDTLDAPVILVDQDVTASFANLAASAALGIPQDEIPNQKGGNVFTCQFARTPEGCGQSQHCSGCTIRRCVTMTHATGAPFVEVPLTLQQVAGDSARDLRLSISTVKLGHLVLLRIDRLGEPSGEEARGIE